MSLLLSPVSEHVWQCKYQWTQPHQVPEPDINATWERVALAVSAAEPHHQDQWYERFRGLLQDFRFLPGGRILANAGTHRSATWLNCFVAGTMEDSMHGIFNTLRETMVTMQAGGGVGIDFSTLRPQGEAARATVGTASGPVSFLPVFEEASRVLARQHQRRGAMMAVLRCDHPDIEQFVHAKRARGQLQHFTLAVACSDAFMQAVQQDSTWALVFPHSESDRPIPAGVEVCERIWSGASLPQLCRVYRRIPARALWSELISAACTSGEPSVLFVDHIQRDNNLWYCEKIEAANPCAEVPLPAHGACNLGSINLAQLVHHPFSAHPRFDMVGLRALASVAVRFLDDVYELTPFPLSTQDKVARSSRRIGLGVTGLADMLLMLGLRYGSDASLELVREIMTVLRNVAYQTSIALAQEKGAFARLDKIKFGASSFVLNLPHELQDGIATHSIRNSHLLAVAPAGSISLLANNISSGIEPVFAFQGQRMVRGLQGQNVEFDVENAAVAQYRQLFGKEAALPEYFVTAQQVSIEDQLLMVAAIQPYIDNAVSKTVCLPHSATESDVENALMRSWQLGLKGCSVYRMSPDAIVR